MHPAHRQRARWICGRGTLAMLAVLASLAGAALAYGQGPAASAVPAAPPSAATKAEARERFDRGLRLFERNELAGALAEFKRANEILPNPLVLYNMGLVYAAMNRPVEATDALDAFLAQASRQRERRQAEKVRAEQAARIARLLVQTDSPATVELDGVEVARTPLVEPLRVASGAHVVGALAPGYLPVRKEITLAGQVSATVVLELIPAQSRLAQLVVTSVPAGAEVRINDGMVGTTPLPTSVAVEPGTARVEVRRSGYHTAVRTLALADGAHGELAFVLEEDPGAAAAKGTLRLRGAEPDVEVVVDGRPRKTVSGALVLPEGLHDITVARPGFEPVRQTLVVPAGRETPLVVPWTPTAETQLRYQKSAHTRRVLGWTLVGVGAALAIAGTAYGASKLDDVDHARTALDGVLANEAEPSHRCFAAGPEYDAYRCGELKGAAQDQVDKTELRRNLGFVGAGVGLVSAAVGSYLLIATGHANRHRAAAAAALRVWSDGRGSGVLLGGRF